MKKKLLFVLFAVLTLAMGATAATSSVIERTGKSIKHAPVRQPTVSTTFTATLRATMPRLLISAR